jgi:Na+-driven multidrug efflux pump
MMQIAASLVTVLLNYSLLKYGGELAVASVGIINRVAMLVLMPIFGINQGVQPIVGYNYGAGSFSRVRLALKIAVCAASVLCIAGFLFIEIFAEYVIGIFNNNPDLIAMGSHGLRIMCSLLPIVGFQVVGSGYFQAVGQAGNAALLSLSRQVIILIPLIVILPNFFGLEGIWIATPLSDLAAFLLTVWLLYFEQDKLKS